MKNDSWKWWYYVVVGILIVAFGGYELYTIQIVKGIGSLILGALCVAVGLFSRKSEQAEAADTPVSTP